MRHSTIIAAALFAAFALPVLAEPIFPNLGPGPFKDCGTPGALANFCRERRDLSVAEAQGHLGADKVAIWTDGDVFTVAARSQVTAPRMSGALNAPLARLPDSDIWTISARTPGLEAALLDAMIFEGAPVRPAQWRGPHAEPRPAVAAQLTGQTLNVSVASPNLVQTRMLTVYLPPGFDPTRRYPVVYEADGQNTAYHARIVEPLILSGAIRPVVMVGLHSGDNERRMGDYLRDYPNIGDSQLFDNHERFFLQEVVPRAEREWGASSKPAERMLMGHSNGAAWAVETAFRHPEMFGNVYAVSVAGRDRTIFNRAPQIRFFLAAGQLESNFLLRTRNIAEGAARVGHQVTLKTPVAGHSQMVVEAFLDDALVAAFGPSNRQDRVAAR